MAIDLKKKKGRPAKEKVTLKDVVTMKSNLEIKLEQAYANLEVKDVIIADLEKKLDEAYKDEEEMLAGIKKHAEMIKYHCARVQDETGSLTAEDIDYSISLLLRIMKHKFEYKPQNWEE
jgi:hypothetical protein